jgi:hypothetical protein
MKLNALLVDLVTLGDSGWGYLESVCSALPDLPVVVCSESKRSLDDGAPPVHQTARAHWLQESSRSAHTGSRPS